MRYDTSREFNAQCARDYLDRLIGRGAHVEVKHIRKTRSNNANSYLHAMLSLFGLEFGWTVEEAKRLVKRELGYVYEKNGHKFLMETRSMDSAQFAAFVEKFRRWALDELNFYVPSSDEYGIDRDQIDNLIEQNQNLL